MVILYERKALTLFEISILHPIESSSIQRHEGEKQNDDRIFILGEVSL